MIKYHDTLIQGSDEWLAARAGLLTASEMKHIITPKKLEYAENDKEKMHLYELAAQRITKYVEPAYISDDMLRGMVDEIQARDLYSQHIATVEQCGFITNDKWGFTLGYSPDGLVGYDGQIECKGRRQKFQIQTITEGAVPSDFLLQVQTGLLVSERQWCDYISFHGGIPMIPIRVYADPVIHAAIEAAATMFHQKLEKIIKTYEAKLADTDNRLIPTERRVETQGEIAI